MNTLIRIALASVLATITLGTAEARSIRMEVNGLVCAFCANGITQALKKETAAGEVFVSLEDKLVAVQLKDGQDISDDTMKRTLTEAGYTVVSINRTDATVAQIKAEVGDD